MPVKDMNIKPNRGSLRSAGRPAAVPAKPEKLGEILSRLFAARGWGRRHERIQLEEAWSEVIGQRGAAHTQVNALRRGILEIRVDSSVLLQELAHFQKRRLLEQLRIRLPALIIKDLRFRAGVKGREGQ
jgi:predicted nucleic acid-binding Zn ribbon protein